MAVNFPRWSGPSAAYATYRWRRMSVLRVLVCPREAQRIEDEMFTVPAECRLQLQMHAVLGEVDRARVALSDRLQYFVAVRLYRW